MSSVLTFSHVFLLGLVFLGVCSGWLRLGQLTSELVCDLLLGAEESAKAKYFFFKKML